MALPVITPNSPAQGSIKWTATNITWDGEDYVIPAGSTSKRFVWWEYRSGTPALLDGDVLPELGSEDVLLFINRGGVGALVPYTQVIDGSLLVTGSVIADAISANAINTHHINANAVVADSIAANAIGADHIGANTIDAHHIGAGEISAEKLSVGSIGDNLVLNGSFEDYDFDAYPGIAFPLTWRKTKETLGEMGLVSGVASSGTSAMLLDCTNVNSDLRFEQKPEAFIPVSAASGRR